MSLLIESLLNGLWQGMALTLVAGLAVRLLRPRPGLRYGIWYAALGGVCALPVLHLIRNLRLSRLPAVELPLPMPPTSSGTQPAALLPIEVPGGTLIWLVLVVWLAGAVLLAARLALGISRLESWKRRSSEPGATVGEWERALEGTIGPGRCPRLRASAEVALPLTAGLLRPAVLFPHRLMERLTRSEFRDIWLHETAHLRRYKRLDKARPEAGRLSSVLPSRGRLAQLAARSGPRAGLRSVGGWSDRRAPAICRLPGAARRVCLR